MRLIPTVAKAPTLSPTRPSRLIHQIILSASLLLVALQTHAQTTVAGSIPGQFAVSPSGAATYRIPLQVPPGVAGMQPRLELIYNSQAGNGLFGIGWGLSGLSAISRCPQTKAQDGVMAGVKFDTSDKYCLDGQRLILVSGTYGAADSEYRTEIETFSKITAKGSAGNGPASFEVKTKSGLTLEYGNTTDSRIEAIKATGSSATWPAGTVRIWANNKTSDVAGNYMSTSYVEDSVNGEYYPKQIDYSGNSTTGATTTKSVQFVVATTPRLDIQSGNQAGAKMRTSQRMGSIKTYNGANLAKEYRLTYTAQSAPVQASKLATISECDASGNCLSPIQVDWNLSNNGAMATKSTFNIKDANLTNSLQEDFNADGKTDILRWDNTASNNVLYLSNGDGTFTKAASFNLTNVVLSNTSHTLGILQGDFNADGKQDLLRWSDTPADNQLYLGNGDGSFTLSSSFNLAGIQLSHSNKTWGTETADFNGDGRTDILRWSDTAANNILYLSNGDGSFTAASGFNLASTQLGHSNKTIGLLLGDFNGDGKADLLRWSNTAADNRLYLGNGDGSFTQSTAFNLTTTQLGHSNNTLGTLLADFNGDGATDLLRWSDERTSNELYLSNADGTFTATVIPSFVAKPNYRAYYGSYNTGKWSSNHEVQLRSPLVLEPTGIDNIASGIYPGIPTYYCPLGYLISANGISNRCVKDKDEYYDASISSWTCGDHAGVYIGGGNCLGFVALPNTHINYYSCPISGYTLSGQRCTLSSMPNASTALGIKDTWFKHSSNAFGVILGDFNGDGLTDILRWFGYYSQSGRNALFLSNGDGTFTASTSYNIGDTLGHNTGTYGSMLGDFNGDGSADVLRWASSATSNALYQSNENIPTDRVQRISVGASNTAPTYSPITTASTYTKDSGSNKAVYPQLDIQAPMYVVSSVSKSDGLGGNNITNYSYGGLKAELGTGRGMLGFRWVKNQEVATGLENYTEYRQDYPYTAAPVRNEVRLAGQGNAGVLQRSTTTYQCTNPQTVAACAVAAGNRYFVYQATSLNQSWELGGNAYPESTATASYAVNPGDGKFYGDIDTTVLGKSDGSSHKTVNEYWPADSTNWMIGKLKKATVTSVTP